MEKYTMFMDWKNQYSENEYISPSVSVNKTFLKLDNSDFPFGMKVIILVLKKILPVCAMVKNVEIFLMSA